MGLQGGQELSTLRICREEYEGSPTPVSFCCQASHALLPRHRFFSRSHLQELPLQPRQSSHYKGGWTPYVSWIVVPADMLIAEVSLQCVFSELSVLSHLIASGEPIFTTPSCVPISRLPYSLKLCGIHLPLPLTTIRS